MASKEILGTVWKTLQECTNFLELWWTWKCQDSYGKPTYYQINVCGEQAYTYIVLSLCSAHIIDIRENDVHQTKPGVEARFLIQQVRTVCEFPHLLFFFFCESYCWKYRERKRDIQCCLSSYLREVQSKSISDKFSLKNKYKRRAPAGNDGCLCSAESFMKQKHVFKSELGTRLMKHSKVTARNSKVTKLDWCPKLT